MKISLTDKRIEARDSSVSGTGVFAKEPIRKGERVAIFGGYVLSVEEFDALKEKDIEAYRTVLEIGYQVDDDAIFSPTNSSQFSTIEYLNHSCEPSCGFDGPIHLVAMRDIESGEEICMDYATCISLDMFAIENCSCGSASCRQKVTANDWKNLMLQEKYGNFFQPYLLKKMQQINKKTI